jgi:hypothetical protein
MRQRLVVLADEDPDPRIRRPHVRGDCIVCPSCQAWRDSGTARTCRHSDDQAVAHSRPCIFAGCKYSLFLDVHPRSGALKLNFPELDSPLDLGGRDSCVIDVTEALGETTLDVVGAKLNVTRERARQIEAHCIASIGGSLGDNGFRQLLPGEPTPDEEYPLPNTTLPPEEPPEILVVRRSRSEIRRMLRASEEQARSAMRRILGTPAPSVRLVALVVRQQRQRELLARFSSRLAS